MCLCVWTEYLKQDLKSTAFAWLRFSLLCLHSTSRVVFIKYGDDFIQPFNKALPWIREIIQTLSYVFFFFLFTQGLSWSCSCLLFLPHIPDSLRKCKFLNLPTSFCLLFNLLFKNFFILEFDLLSCLIRMWIALWTSSSVFASPPSLPRPMLCKHTQAILTDLLAANTVSYNVDHTVLYFYVGSSNRLWHTYPWLLKRCIYSVGPTT